MEPLVSKTEAWLADGGLLAIALGLALRWLLWFALTRSNSLLDSQLIVGGLLLALLNLAGLLLPRALSAIPVLLGTVGWLFGLSLLPRYFPLLWKTSSESPRPEWMVWGALGLALGSFLLRWLLARQWSAQIYGKGWAWIDNWARARSLRARVLARKALITLGYRRARDAGAVE